MFWGDSFKNILRKFCYLKILVFKGYFYQFFFDITLFFTVKIRIFKN